MGSAWCHLGCCTELHLKPVAKDIHLHLAVLIFSLCRAPDTFFSRYHHKCGIIKLQLSRNFLYQEHSISLVIPSRFLTNNLTNSTILYDIDYSDSISEDMTIK